MHGNVSEWCWDLYEAEYYQHSPNTDPIGPEQMSMGHVRRGGSINSDESPNSLGSAGRERFDKVSDELTGFRVVRTDPSAAADVRAARPRNTPATHDRASNDHSAPKPAPAPPPDDKPTVKEQVSRSLGMTFVRIPAGTFVMGADYIKDQPYLNNSPRHRVQLARSFYLGKYEVTQGEYSKVMNENPSWFSPAGEGSQSVAGLKTDRFPVEKVSWTDAVRFCNDFSARDGLAPFYRIDGERVTVPDWRGLGYRLPTEAEWEYVCRAGTDTLYSFGDDSLLARGNYVWSVDNALRRAHPVGEKLPNPWGLFDMHGNVYEWCWDSYKESYDAILINPIGPKRRSETDACVVRSGSYISYYQYWDSQSRSREQADPRYRYADVGFRVARNSR
jgi:formylglycine-generating enzyme required for sulfatase activity